MLAMGQIKYITGLEKYEGLSLREICKRTGYHFNTVKKYIDKENWNEEIKPNKERKSKLDEVKPIIDEWLRIDIKMPRKQRHTGTRVYDRLKEEHSDKLLVGKQTVINYVTKTKRELCKSVYDTAIFGYHPYGQAQVDFGEVYAFNRVGTMIKYHELVMTFPASNAGYTQICKSQNAECLLEAMQNIFEHIGFVPTRILFDNMSSAVVKILPKGKRKLTNHLERFVLHYGFNAAFCNPNKGQEKGSVENKVGYKRRNFFVPVPTITDLKGFNKTLLNRCDNDLNRMHYIKKELISELFDDDKSEMNDLPAERFNVIRLEKVKTDNYSFARFENNRYSTSPEFNRCELWLEIGAENIRVLDEKYREIVVHKRQYCVKTEPIIDWKKYLVAVSRKPNSFRYTSFFKELPEVWQIYFKQADFDERKKMLNILTPIILDEKLHEATTLLKTKNIKDAEDFMASFRGLHDTSNSVQVTTKHTPNQMPYKQDLSVYKGLIGGGNNE